MMSTTLNAEQIRINDAKSGIAWKKWGPYLSERQWGTVREDYSESGDAWNYFSHDQARSRAYRWGEDGIGGISDDQQHLCFALALWNGKDPILKERLFGLTNTEGNHGEDVKEYYFYLDSTPTHSYMKYLYKYPQSAFPYDDLVKTNKLRNRQQIEYELIDTGVFNENKYFDVFIEYAKSDPEDILIKITIYNRGPENATIHILPTVWFRKDWENWTVEHNTQPLLTDAIAPEVKKNSTSVIKITHHELGVRYLWCDQEVPLLFTDNITNNSRIFPEKANESLYTKDGINNYIVSGTANAINPNKTGTKAAAHYQINIPAGEAYVVRLRLTDSQFQNDEPFGSKYDEIFNQKLSEADEFYKSIIPAVANQDTANIMRQAIAGMLWSKQFYYFNADVWLKEHHINPLNQQNSKFRNHEWFHMINKDIISMPDKWEYPWYAAWDLAFHTLPISLVDSDFAKEQMKLILRGYYLHPSGQIPAYEWNFSDVNPPVHAWATIFLHRTEIGKGKEPDFEFLKFAFNKLMLNFTWWVNRKDRFGKNVFEGGFLGLDNIGIFDRSAPLPTGGYLEQADGTAWMALFTQNMLEIAIELACYDSSFEDLCFKFIEHFYYIAAAMNQKGANGMWDEEDGFYYDLLRLPDGTAKRLKVRSIVGLLPLCATTIIEKWQQDKVPNIALAAQTRLKQMPELLESIHPTGQGHFGVAERGIGALINQDRLRRILTRMLDENEFLSPYGIRSLSKFHENNPYILNVAGKEYRVDYMPAESKTELFGGNSNWRGPIWMPVNILIIRGLLNFYLYYGDNFKIECPTGSGKMMNLFEVSKEIANRLINIFLRNDQGKRPVYGGTEKFQNDPMWKDHILFYEYFHGDNGAGLGASHQTGWTGLVATLIELFSKLDEKDLLNVGKIAAFKK